MVAEPILTDGDDFMRPSSARAEGFKVNSTLVRHRVFLTPSSRRPSIFLDTSHSRKPASPILESQTLPAAVVAVWRNTTSYRTRGGAVSAVIIGALCEIVT